MWNMSNSGLADLNNESIKLPAMLDEQGWSNAIERICVELGWKKRVQHLNGRTQVICPLPTDAHFAGVLFVISSDASRIVVYVTYRIKVSSKHFDAMSELTMQLNSRLLGGCLEIFPERGEVRYRDGLLLVKPEVDEALLQAVVATILRDALACHLPIEAVASGHSPAKALADIEKS
jgi:hypothetical protein